jgi:hypothetical protein
MIRSPYTRFSGFSRFSGFPRFVLLAAAGLVMWSTQDRSLVAQPDLDAFMRQVMERRDDNWKKLQQYILDEREEFDLRGPGGFPLWGERREFTWFIKDGFFVRSPLKVNGATVGENDRRKYEDNYLRQQKARDRRARDRAAAGATATTTSSKAPPATTDADAVDSSDADPGATQSQTPSDIESFIQQTRQPEFISSAYFLRFRFDEGRYALVGREKLDGRDVLKVEYYPQKLFRDEESERRRERQRARERERSGQSNPNAKRVDDTVNRLMNQGSRITLWIEPTARQIIKYTFDNVDLDFFPVQWLVNIGGIHATMTMGQPFPEIWLPRDMNFLATFMVAVGQVEARYSLEYHDYRQADVTTAIRVPEVR